MIRYDFNETTIDISDRYLTTKPITKVFLKKDMTPLTGTVYALENDGKLKFEISFSAGLANGTYQAWNRYGGLIWEFNYINGLKHGEYKYWFDNGNIQTHGWYRNDKLEGLFQSWRKTGKLFVQTHYKNGLLHGQEKCFFQNGHESKEHLFNQGEYINSKHFKHHQLQKWTGQRISDQVKLRFSHDYANGVLKKELLFFSVITEKGANILKEEGLATLNKMKGRSCLLPVIKVKKTYHENGFLKFEEIYETHYTNQCMLRRTWNENGKQVTFEQPYNEGRFFLLKDERNYFDNNRIRNEEIRCYFKPFDKIFFIDFINTWYENGQLKSVLISDSYNVAWVKKAWDENGVESEVIINIQSSLF